MTLLLHATLPSLSAVWLKAPYMQKEIAHSEAELLQMLAEGSELAFQILYKNYSPGVVRMARKVLNNDLEMVSDLQQELFARIWAKRQHFTHVQNFQAYIIKMTKSLALDYVKKLIRQELATSEFTERIELDDSDLYLLFDEIIEKLPPRQQEIYHLAKVEGLSHECIAEKLHVSRRTVSNHMHRALQFLKNQSQIGHSASTISLLICLLVG